jgi:hypothetical protein
MATAAEPSARASRKVAHTELTRTSTPVPAMSVIPLTLTISLCLVFTFVVFFLHEHSRPFRNAGRESLPPLADETPRAARRDDR